MLSLLCRRLMAALMASRFSFIFKPECICSCAVAIAARARPRQIWPESTISLCSPPGFGAACVRGANPSHLSESPIRVILLGRELPAAASSMAPQRRSLLKRRPGPAPAEGRRTKPPVSAGRRPPRWRRRTVPGQSRRGGKRRRRGRKRKS